MPRKAARWQPRSYAVSAFLKGRFWLFSQRKAIRVAAVLYWLGCLSLSLLQLESEPTGGKERGID